MAPGLLESAAGDLLADAFHDAGPDRQSELPAEVVAHSVPVGPAVANDGRDRFKPAVRLHVGEDVIDPPCVELVLDRLHPLLPFALARRRRLHGGVRAIKDMALVEDEGQVLSGEGLLAGGLDPRRAVGQHHQFLGREQAVPEPELPQPSAELRGPVGRRLRAVDAGAGRAAVLILPGFPGLRVPTVGREGGDDLRLDENASPSTCLGAAVNSTCMRIAK